MSGPREFGEYEADKAASSGPSERETARDWDFENKADEELDRQEAEIDNPPKYDPQDSAEAMADGWN